MLLIQPLVGQTAPSGILVWPHPPTRAPASQTRTGWGSFPSGVSDPCWEVRPQQLGWCLARSEHGVVFGWRSSYVEKWMHWPDPQNMISNKLPLSMYLILCSTIVMCPMLTFSDRAVFILSIKIQSSPSLLVFHRLNLKPGFGPYS